MLRRAFHIGQITGKTSRMTHALTLRRDSEWRGRKEIGLPKVPVRAELRATWIGEKSAGGKVKACSVGGDAGIERILESRQTACEHGGARERQRGVLPRSRPDVGVAIRAAGPI